MSRDPHAGLIAALAERSGGPAASLGRRDWASATFVGETHMIALSLPAAVADDFIAALADMEFALPGHLVADIVVSDRGEEGATARLTIEALTLVEG